MADKQDINKPEFNEIPLFTGITTEDRLAKLEDLIIRHTHDGRETRNITGNIPSVQHGTAAPASIPKKIGDIFCRTDNGKVYIATGTSTSSDWKLLN